MSNNKRKSLSLSIDSKESEAASSSRNAQEVHKLDEALALTKFGKFNVSLIFSGGLILTTVSVDKNLVSSSSLCSPLGASGNSGNEFYTANCNV